MPVTDLFRAQEPAVPVRGVHLDLKGVPPTADHLARLLEVLAGLRYNAVLVEWEDMFPWNVDVRFRCETAYTPEDVERFHAAAAALGIAVIPLVQCLGHMETPLSVPGYEHLREVPYRSDVLNPLAPGARDLVERMVVDVLARSPGVKHFHLGGDEAWSFGTHPDTRAYIEKHGKGALYLQHVEPILDLLNARGVRPILWHDMMREWDGDALRRLAAKADLCAWGYQGHPDTTRHHFSSKNIERFKEHGIALWGGTAYKGADGHNADLPVLANREQNALAWVEVARRYGFLGIFTTAWSRYSTHDVQNEPIDAALDSLASSAVILHDGRAPEGGIDACLAALGELGARERFEACKSAMQELSDLRRRGWQVVQQAREQMTTATMDGRRRGSGVLIGRLRALREVLAGLDGVAERSRRAFAGLMDPLWTDRYLAERIEPLREELAAVDERVRQVDPAGYAGLGR